jgi:hypothetical protein
MEHQRPKGRWWIRLVALARVDIVSDVASPSVDDRALAPVGRWRFVVKP